MNRIAAFSGGKEAPFVLSLSLSLLLIVHLSTILKTRLLRLSIPPRYPPEDEHAPCVASVHFHRRPISLPAVASLRSVDGCCITIPCVVSSAPRGASFVFALPIVHRRRRGHCVTSIRVESNYYRHLSTHSRLLRPPRSSREYVLPSSDQRSV